jgi:replicative DNA helicase
MRQKKTLYDSIESRAAQLAEQYDAVRRGDLPPITRISTGLESLDAYGLFTLGILTLVVMHPGDGKTSVVMQTCEGAVGQGFTPWIWAPEDPLPFVADRFLAKSMNVSAFKLREIELDGNISQRLSAAAQDLDWARQVRIEDRKLSPDEFFEELGELGEETGIAIADYAQVFDTDEEDKTLERIIAKVSWGMSQWSKHTGNASVLMSQPKPAVAERGRRMFDAYISNKRFKGEEIKPENSLVEGYRPMDGDANNCTAAYQRAKDFISGFRPGRWLNQHGFGVKDDRMEFVRTKGNYSPGQYPVRVGWRGETTSLYDLTKKEK